MSTRARSEILRCASRFSLRLVALGLVTLGLHTLGGSSARATTMIPLDLPGLTARAEVVIAGRVTETRCAWTADHEAIYTDVTVHIDRVLAGPLRAGQELVIRREGGVVDGVGMKVFGAPSFAKNEEVVLFVERRGGAHYVVGMAQGKLRVYTDASGHKRLRRNLSEVGYTRPPTDAERKLSNIETIDELAVEVERLSRIRK